MTDDAMKAVEEAARAARDTAADLASVPDERLDAALRAIADALGRQAAPVLAANEADMAAGREAGLGTGLLDRLRLDEARLEAIAGQLRALADVPYEATERVVRELPGHLTLTERRRPVGVIGANFEARPNVVVDVASQFVKSRNAGVLRTGSAAIRSAVALADEVIAPALAASGLDPAMIGLVRVPGQESARALVSQPGLIPLVILRGSGDSTRSLAAEAARHGVRTMAHADGGAVLYVRRRRRPGPGRGADRGQPGPARRVQPAQPAADPPGCVGRGPAAGRDAARPGWGSRPRCRRTRTRSGTSGRWIPGTRRRSPSPRPTARAPRPRWPTPRPPGWPPRSSPRTRPRPTSSFVVTRVPARSGTPAPGCWTASSCSRCRRPASTSTPCPGRAARSTFRDLYLRQFVVTPA